MEKLDVEYDLVFIIDSLSQQERDENKISEELMDYLTSQGIKQIQRKCKNKNMVLKSFSDMNILADKGQKFCLQIVSHGTENGLFIKETNEYIYWDEFTNILNKINQKLDNTLIVNMSSCRGLNGIKIVNSDVNLNPFFGLIGCHRDLFFWEAKIVNKLLYSKILESKDIAKIVPEIQQELIEYGSKDIAIYNITSEEYKRKMKDPK